MLMMMAGFEYEDYQIFKSNKPWRFFQVTLRKSPYTPLLCPYLPPTPPSPVGVPQFHPNWMESLMYRRLASLYGCSLHWMIAPPYNDRAECCRHPILPMPPDLRGRYCHHLDSANSSKPCQLQNGTEMENVSESFSIRTLPRVKHHKPSLFFTFAVRLFYTTLFTR